MLAANTSCTVHCAAWCRGRCRSSPPPSGTSSTCPGSSPHYQCSWLSSAWKPGCYWWARWQDTTRGPGSPLPRPSAPSRPPPPRPAAPAPVRHLEPPSLSSSSPHLTSPGSKPLVMSKLLFLSFLRQNFVILVFFNSLFESILNIDDQRLNQSVFARRLFIRTVVHYNDLLLLVRCVWCSQSLIMILFSLWSEAQRSRLPGEKQTSIASDGGEKPPTNFPLQPPLTLNYYLDYLNSTWQTAGFLFKSKV